MTRVAVTGLGALTPLGPDVAALTEGLLSGRSGVRLLEGQHESGIAWDTLPARLAATVDLEGRLERLEARTLDRVQQLALVAAREAWAHAGAPEVESTRLAVIIGSGIGGALTILSQYDVLKARWA
jgi:3-oxoacyl-[acyl-carrier-protein] synthase II